MSKPKILVFGPQALSLDDTALRILYNSLQSNPLHSWVLHVLSTLPETLASISEALPELELLRIQTQLDSLSRTLRTGDVSTDLFPLSNAVLSPLVVISQLMDYMTYIKTVEPGLCETSLIPNSMTAGVETLGLCTGILSSFAVASSATIRDLQRYGATSIRLALLSGSLVDSEDASRNSESRSTSFSASWAAASLTDLESVLQRHPESYISVRMDERRATITCPHSTLSEIQSALRELGIHVSNVTLSGRFHWPAHHATVKEMLQLVNRNPKLQLPEASRLVLPTRANSGAEYLRTGNLHEIALRAILTDQSHWYQTLGAAYTSQLQSPDSQVLCFGTERCIPPSIARKLDTRLIHVADEETSKPFSLGPAADFSSGSDDRIAVIGMSCQVPNAEDLDSYWQVLLSGESQHREVPPERFSMQSAVREVDPKTKWYGNFVCEPDVFDHKFFKKSPREMGSTDPQHRIALQLAYQAVEQSGYFSGSVPDKHIGVYVGHANTDYEHNIRCYPANAYSATGNLKSFLAGKISHYFGWTGPSMTLDTACSSSSVAIHLACRAILSGDITAALAGGVNIFTSPEWYYNLAGALFLSPTGQCKSFDSKGDGYCRGEGAGFVVLKKLSDALKDGDQILGVIASTSVLQNQNSTPITVPNSTSLAELFRGVVKRAKIRPYDVSVVEAHGTGTSVGDPAEYDGIRQVFGGPGRSDRLSLTAVKGSIGHLEVASGVASLIKVLLMIHEATVPPQASFQTINPNLKAQPSDNIDIVTTQKSWTTPTRAALINNYGASGSNASMIVTEAPMIRQQRSTDSAEIAKEKFPFWFSGADESSLKKYAVKLRELLRRKLASGRSLNFENLSFQVARQSNRTLTQALVVSASSIEDLDQKLSDFNNGSSISSFQVPGRRPVIMCFGGQISTFVGLDKSLFDSVSILRWHLNECNAACLALGLHSIFPDIFQRSPLLDTAKLQIILFATQYSCAMAWIDCGIEVSAIVGHSFGELTGLCVSGALPLKAAIQMISERARIIQRLPETDKGSMMAVEGELTTVKALIHKAFISSGMELSIACYNSLKSFTLAGSTDAVMAAEQIIKTDATFAGMRAKALNVTHAFHSNLMDPIMAELTLLGQRLTFRKPHIRLERATEQAEQIDLDQLNGDYISRHLRSPVFFHHAVKRLSDEFDNAIWLEAGSKSTVTNMASKVLDNTITSFFQPINITTDASFLLLVEATTNLWRQGLNVTFWPHHKSQASEYTPILLPPYQFEKSRHWLDIKDPPMPEEAVPASINDDEKGLASFFGFLDESKQSMRFRLNTATREFNRMVEGHVMANTAAVMPGMLPAEIVIEAILATRPDLQDSGYQPEIQSMVYYCPLVPQHCSVVWLDTKATDAAGLTWDWKIIGQDAKGTSTRYISGLLVLFPPECPSVKRDFARLSRLGSYKRCRQLLDGKDADDVVIGRNIYRAFETVIDYKDIFRHLTKLVGKDGDSAGRVVRAHEKDGWLDSILTDCFCQVGGIAANLFSDVTDFAQRDIFIGDRVDRWIRAPGLRTDPAKPQEWDVFSMSERESDTAFICDIFAFDARDGSLYEAILGIRYSKAPLASMQKLLGRVITENPLSAVNIHKASAPSMARQMPMPATRLDMPAQQPQMNSFTETLSIGSNTPNGVSITHANVSIPPMNGTRISSNAVAIDESASQIPAKAKEILSNLSGIDADDINDDSDLFDMGIDSLMAMELNREIDAKFKCTLQTDQLMILTDFRSLVTCISIAMGVGAHEVIDAEQERKPVPKNTEPHITNGINGSHRNGAVIGINGNGVNGHNENGHSVNGQAYEASINGTNGINHLNGKDDFNGSKALEAELPRSLVLDVFRATKAVTDEFIVANNMSNYYSEIRPRSTLLCAAYIAEAFEKLGCRLQDAHPGQKLLKIPYLTKHAKFMMELYKIIGPEETGLVEISEGNLVRTSVPCPKKTALMLLQEALRDEPEHAAEFKLVALTGCRLAECLSGDADGLQIIFGSAEGRQTVSDVYAIAPINSTWTKQAAFFVEELLRRLPADSQRINILEVGAGTGGTTIAMVPMLASLGIPVTYTFTDLSSSLVAAARKRFKQYPFMEFKVANIESAPDKGLAHSQHIIIGNACVHATRSLPISLRNLRDMLRPDGMLVLIEETEQLPWVDFVFGLLEGWWLFEDGRNHAQVSAQHWEKALLGAGFGHVDYTDGLRREAQLQRIIVGFASDIRYAAASAEPPYPLTLGRAELTSLADRQAVIDKFLRKYTADFHMGDFASSHKLLSLTDGLVDSGLHCVLVTGATGSLGSHIVSAAARLSNVRKIICLNRLGTIDAVARQRESFKMRGIEVEPSYMSKLQILEADTSKHALGLVPDVYDMLVRSVTHIIHSAWPMSLTRTAKAYEPQFQTMRNLIDLARDCANTRPPYFQVSFQFISSIGAVGYYPLWTGRSLALEIPTTADTALPVGYADAKIVCERMLQQTLRMCPNRFRAMAVRIAQITGSRSNGYWNPIEHFSFFVKSAQFLRSLPDLQGSLSWSPVDDVAASLLDILTSRAAPYAIYHIENPVRQPWPEMISLLAKELNVPPEHVVPYDQWVERVRGCDASVAENPAKQLTDFWETHFLRMSTGPLILDTRNSREHSKTMREHRPVEEDLVKQYIERWKLTGFLQGI